MTNLEQSMVDLIDRNGLLCFEIGRSQGTHEDGEPYGYFNAMVQWFDAAGNRGIATGNGDTIEAAMSRMMQVMAAKRPPVATMTDEPLPSIAA